MSASNRLTKILTIGGIQVTNLVSDNVQLDLFSPGRAILKVVCESDPSGMVELHLGYQVDNMQPYFLGVIESKHKSNGHWFLTCRELLGALSFPKPMAIRHATIPNVLNELSNLGLGFICPEADYCEQAIPAFYHNGDGISALRQIGKVWGIADFIFQQRPDGKIYVGSWHDSRWPQAQISNFEEHPIKVLSTNTGEIIAVPKLRPGIKLNGRYITEVTLTGNKQVLRWSKTLLDV